MINDTTANTFSQLTNQILGTKSAAKEAAQIKKMPFSELISGEGVKDTINGFKTRLSELAEALEKLQSGKLSNSDLLELFEKFPELANRTDDLDTALNELIDSTKIEIGNQFDSWNKSMPTDEDVEGLNAVKNSLIGIVEKSKDIEQLSEEIKELNSALDSLQSTYNDIQGVIDDYNKNGYLTLDNLQSLYPYTTKTRAEFDYLWNSAQIAIQKYQGANETLIGVMNRLQGEIYATDTQINALDGEIDNLGEAIDSTNSALDSTSGVIDNVATSLGGLGNSISDYIDKLNHLANTNVSGTDNSDINPTYIGRGYDAPSGNYYYKVKFRGRDYYGYVGDSSDTTSVRERAYNAIITSKLKNRTVRILLGIVMTGISVYGFYLFFKSDMLNYMLLKNPFAFLDYEKAWWLVLLENLAMLLAWGFAAYLLSLFLRSITKKDKRKPALLFALLLIVVIVSGIVLNTALNSQQTSATPSWSTPQNNPTQATVSKDNKGISDNYVLIKGGIFLMGSPESENWRGDDETQHKVTVADFYISPYEITQAEYQLVMGENPSTYTGDKLPAENISYIEALQFANKKSELEGLNPVYTISNQTITWNRSANGYRLQTEAEWEYACRAGTTTPFNLEHSLDAGEADMRSYNLGVRLVRDAGKSGLSAVTVSDESVKCVIKDDMSTVLDKIQRADVLVVATPTCFLTMNGMLKTTIDRFLPKWKELGGHDVYLIITGHDRKVGLKLVGDELSEVFSGLDNRIRKIIWGENVWQKGEVKGTKAMDEAYQAGVQV